MIKNFTFLLVFLCLALTSMTAQTYVNGASTGSNDGTSWENAYSNLDTALAKTASGEIWIAAGTYRHDGAAPDTFRTFFVGSDVDLYGGFAGTESSKEERDVQANVTILSADFNGDDIEGSFDTLRDDNSYHVVTVDSLIASPVIFDGLTISGGKTGLNGDLSQYNRRGAGIYSWTTLEVNNCVFKDNFCRAAGGIFLDPAKSGGSGSKVTNSSFTGNYADARGAGLYFFNLSDVLIENNVFSGNTTNAGCVYPFRSNNIMIRKNVFSDNSPSYSNTFSVGVYDYRSTNVTIDSCQFLNNSAANATSIYFDADSTLAEFSDNLVVINSTFDGNEAFDFGGAGLYMWQGVGVRVENCVFQNNSANSQAGAVYLDGRSQVISDDNVVFINTRFINNSAPVVGGALRFFNASSTFEDCYLEGNTSGSSGAIYASGERGQLHSFDDCTFNKNISGGFGNLNLYGAGAQFDFTNCTFTENTAVTSAAGIITGFLATTTLDSCLFEGNSSEGSAAAIRVQNDSTYLIVNNSTFTENVAQSSAGAIFKTQGSIVTIDNSIFTSNAADRGGAISVTEDTVAGNFILSNSILQFNSATTQAGALNIEGTDAMITNTLFNNNFNFDGFAGGAISGNSGGADDTVAITIINSTFADNEAPIGSGLGLWTDGANGAVTVNLQNNIFDNEGANYLIEDGTPTVVSYGGNLSTDASFAGIFNADLGDVEETEAQIFVDKDDQDFHLADGSPAINIGIAEGAPEMDIEGNLRIGPPDAGAYESQFDVSVKDILVENNNQLRIAPNPVMESLNIILENDWEGSFTAKLFNVNGQQVNTWNFNKFGDLTREQFNVTNLTPGFYDLVVGDESKVVTVRVVKL